MHEQRLHFKDQSEFITCRHSLYTEIYLNLFQEKTLTVIPAVMNIKEETLTKKQ